MPRERYIFVGNPPYQEKDGGHAASARPVYHQFIQHALQHGECLFIIPARWYAGGKGLDQFREQLLARGQVRTLHDYPDASSIFPNVSIAGGVCIIHVDPQYSGVCHFTTPDGHGVKRRLDEPPRRHPPR